MEEMQFIYCPTCGARDSVTYKDNRHWVCSACGFNLYNNVAASVATILQDNRQRVLFVVREKEPRKGYLALPGGFIDPDESAEEAALRECREEIGVAPEKVEFIASYPNTYEYGHVVYKTCDMFFTGTLSKADADGRYNILEMLTPQQEEVAGFALEAIHTPEDIEKLPLAFPSATRALKRWLELKEH